jgi:hypothetical protein
MEWAGTTYGFRPQRSGERSLPPDVEELINGGQHHEKVLSWIFFPGFPHVPGTTGRCGRHQGDDPESIPGRRSRPILAATDTNAFNAAIVAALQKVAANAPPSV